MIDIKEMHPCKHGAKVFTRKDLTREATPEEIKAFIIKMEWPRTQMMYRRVRDSLKLKCHKLGFHANNLFHYDVSSSNGKGRAYRVIVNGNGYPTCTCPDWQGRFSELIYKSKKTLRPTMMIINQKVLIFGKIKMYNHKDSKDTGL